VSANHEVVIVSDKDTQWRCAECYGILKLRRKRCGCEFYNSYLEAITSFGLFVTDTNKKLAILLIGHHRHSKLKCKFLSIVFAPRE
jgi:hypothetical protein